MRRLVWLAVVLAIAGCSLGGPGGGQVERAAARSERPHAIVYVARWLRPPFPHVRLFAVEEPEQVPARIDEELDRRLRALGYIG